MRVTQLARVERTDFMQPMHIGEVSELIAEITYTSKHSLEVQVTVWAEDIIKGKLSLILSHSEMHIGEVSLCQNQY